MSRSTRLVAPFMRRQWGALVVAGFSTLVVAAADLARPWPLKLVIDYLFTGDRISGSFTLERDDFIVLAAVGGLVLGIALLDALAGYQMDVRLNRAGERIVHELRVATYAHLQRLSLSFHAQRQAGDLVTRVTGDVNAVGGLFSSSLGTLVSAAVTLVGMVVIGVILDPILALAAFATMPLLALVAFRFRRRMRVVSRQQRAMEGEIASLATEALSSIREVKAFGSEGFEHDRLERKSEERLEAGFDATRIEGRFARLVDLLGAVGAALVLVVGVFRVAAGALSPGDLVVMVAYTRRIYKPLRDIAREATRASRAMARADRVAEVLAADEMLEERPGAYSGPKAQGDLELKDVSFGYGPDRQALEDVSLRIPAGRRLAVVGPSGAGKSTLAALVARFYDPSAGQMLLDGRDARDCSLAWLRAQVGLVLQETALFTGTVAENIGYGVDHYASWSEIVDVGKAAGAHGFVSELPWRYDTPIGARGLGLSGGQRQRIAIARTLLRDPAVLVLDEPTRGLDPESEAAVFDGLDALMRGRTTVIITHSLALARKADWVVVLDEGRVIQEGKPENLLAVDGTFRRFALEQGLVADSARRAAVPADEELPQMARLLDPGAVAPALQRSLGSAEAPDVRVRYLRYKPATSLVAHYDVDTGSGWHDAVAMISAKADLARRAGKAEHQALAWMVDGRSPARTPLAYDPDLEALIQWWPLDLSLPAVAEPPERLRLRIEAAGVKLDGAEGEPSLLNYKPRRRAVLGIGDHVVKVYAGDRDFAVAAAGLRAATSLGTFRTGAFEAAVPELRLTVQAFVSGTAPSQADEVAMEAGEILSTLHEARLSRMVLDPLPHFTATEQLKASAASATLISAIAPSLQARLRALLGRFEAEAPVTDVLVPSHGDFHAGQLLDTGKELAVIDFDEMLRAPPALDPATYAAHVVRGEDGDLPAARAALDALLEAYGDRPDATSWYLATSILRRAPFPFRFLDEHWPERVEAMVDAAEEALGT